MIVSWIKQKYKTDLFDWSYIYCALQWRINGRDSVSNHQPHDCLFNHLFRCRSKKISKLGVPGLCARNSPGTDEFPAQMASNAENVSIWWRHHGVITLVAIPTTLFNTMTPREKSATFFSNHFLTCMKLLYLDSNFTAICSRRSN